MNVEIFQGDSETDLLGRSGETFRCWFQFVEADGKTPIHLGGVTSAKAQFRRSPDDSSALFELSVGSGLTIDAAGGRVGVHITDEVTADKVGTSFWDLRLVFANGDVYYLCGGCHVLSNPVTKP